LAENIIIKITRSCNATAVPVLTYWADFGSSQSGSTAPYSHWRFCQNKSTLLVFTNLSLKIRRLSIGTLSIAYHDNLRLSDSTQFPTACLLSNLGATGPWLKHPKTCQ